MLFRYDSCVLIPSLPNYSQSQKLALVSAALVGGRSALPLKVELAELRAESSALEEQLQVRGIYVYRFKDRQTNT